MLIINFVFLRGVILEGSGQVNKASATVTVDLGLIPGWVKPNYKNGIHSFPA